MRVTAAVLLLMALGLSACGEDAPHKTVVVVPQGQTQVAPPGSVTKVCPAGYSTC